jgi:hypothetical protein
MAVLRSIMETLRQSFAAAALPMELRQVPLNWDRWQRADEIVQIDISRERKSTRRGPAERFRIFPGHAENRLEVLGVDAALRQLVLFVDEPERAFEVRVPRRSAIPADAEIVREDKHSVWTRQYTTGRARHFLCGMDEAHLFIALLPDAARSVAAAHATLRDALVDELEEHAPAPTVRQGEWFFVALPDDEAREVAYLARKVLRVTRRVGIAEAARITRVGRPHVADEVLVLGGAYARGDERVYVRGAVRHPDHATIVFDDWRRVIANREAIEAPPVGVDWID